ncbi:hypothetical protein [Novosphingobium sp. CECT 9465]
MRTERRDRRVEVLADEIDEVSSAARCATLLMINRTAAGVSGSSPMT